jgi:hypothetical protein
VGEDPDSVEGEKRKSSHLEVWTGTWVWKGAICLEKGMLRA